MRLTVAAAVLALVIPTFAYADASTDAPKDAEVERLEKANGPLKWNHVPAGKSARYGHAEVLVNAPLAKVKAATVDFAHYRELHRKFASARVTAASGDSVDLYMKVPVRVGPLRLDQWAVMRFGAARATDTSFAVDGRGVQGNMKESHLVVTARAVDEQRSIVKVDLLLVPGMPAPQALMDEELRDAAQDLVAGLRDRAQRSASVLTSL